MATPDIETIEHVVGHRFKDHDLLHRALTHASGVDSRLKSNERLEFLGDAVLGMVVCSHLFEAFPTLMEGELTKIKSTVVSRKVCAEIAKELRLDEILKMGKGMSVHATLPGSVLAAVYEAIVGALYLDAGLEIARAFILRHMGVRVVRAADSGHQFNFKSVLQQVAQQSVGHTPQYVVLDEQGPDHAKCFQVCVELGSKRTGACWGPSKKQAEQAAALQALIDLGIAHRDEQGEIHVKRREADTGLDGNGTAPNGHADRAPTDADAERLIVPTDSEESRAK